MDEIIKFTYNPNGDNLTKDSLNHSEVISLAAYFINTKQLMQDLLVCKFPIVLIDESQDTKKELIDAFFKLQSDKNDSFSLGLFGDTMQRIYADGKEGLGKNLPSDMVTPAKSINHRSNKRIVKLINNIRKEIDNQCQNPRIEKEDGFIRIFICQRGQDKLLIENRVLEKMSEITKDDLWSKETSTFDVKTLILEHHMAARRMGFLDFFEPLYKEDKLSTGLLDGSLSGVNFFTRIILPLISAFEVNDKFEIARIVKKNSKFLKKEEIFKSQKQIENLEKTKVALSNLYLLWDKGNDPLLIDILKVIFQSGLFTIPDTLYLIASRTDDENSLIEKNKTEETNDKYDSVIEAWDLALKSPFSQLKEYNNYLSETAKFGTHQGVKGLEYPRVMVILDDEESKGFLFSYDKLFGSKDLSANDLKNINEGKDTGIDRTRRLFYVACSRAKESLAIVAYTENPEVVRATVLKYSWFEDNEIEIMN